MKNRKLYFCDEIEPEMCYSKDFFISKMKEFGLNETLISEAKRELKTDYFFCKATVSIGIKEETICGRLCEYYKPRNKKSGCCRFRGFCYTPEGKKITLKIKKL